MKGKLLVLLLFTAFASVQGQSTDLKDVVESPRDFRAMFYNVENLFDAQDDSLTRDEEFLPEGERHWTDYKVYEKVQHISKVIIGVGGWQAVDLIGMAEIENRAVLEQLIRQTTLHKTAYQIVHRESPDARGIDVALFYNPATFTLLSEGFFRIESPDYNQATREILYAVGVVNGQDTLHVFVNHWPSRWGGQLESEYKRLAAAQVLRSKVDSLLQQNAQAKILIMGDLNDEPENKSVAEVLGAHPVKGEYQNKELYNMMTQFDTGKTGSHKYKGVWGILDHIIVSGSLLQPVGWTTSVAQAHIYKADFLLEKDETHLGMKPFRTFGGYKYLGGYSDHLPVFIDFTTK